MMIHPRAPPVNGFVCSLTNTRVAPRRAFPGILGHSAHAHPPPLPLLQDFLSFDPRAHVALRPTYVLLPSMSNKIGVPHARPPVHIEVVESRRQGFPPRHNHKKSRFPSSPPPPGVARASVRPSVHPSPSTQSDPPPI